MKEPLEKYLTRLDKQARVLVTLGEELGVGVLETLKATAVYVDRINEAAKDDPVHEVRILKREYGFEMVEIDETLAQHYRILALEAMLTERGVNIVELRLRLVEGATLQTPSPPKDEPTDAQRRGFEPSARSRTTRAAVDGQDRPGSVPSFPMHGQGLSLIHI